jgi:hypothetical protein
MILIKNIIMDDLTCAIGKLLKEECENIIEKICHLKMLDKEDIMEKCLPKSIYFNEQANNIIQKKKKKGNRRVLPTHEQCLGRKMDFTQCTRKRKDATEFCGSHIKNLPNGKIGDDGSCFNKVKGKRGRKRKNIMENIGENDILTTKKYIEGELYLVDNMNIVYNFNQNFPIILGLLKDGKIVDFEE